MTVKKIKETLTKAFANFLPIFKRKADALKSKLVHEKKYLSSLSMN